MKDVQIEFSNIQSHEHTMFSLGPGLNFILADDNNVGKSTIFKVLITAASMPKVSKDDLTGLLRSGTTQGYASFKFEDNHVIFWLFRENATTVRAFFEVRNNGGSTRVATCPEFLLKALDIVLGEDGTPINFNDADSVQLIVEDSHKNDEVLAKVLVDTTIESIRANGVALSREVAQDYKLLSSKLTDQKTVLSSLSFNDSVESFFQEEEFLCAAVRVADGLGLWVDSNEADFSQSLIETQQLMSVVRSYLVLCTVFTEEAGIEIEDWDEIQTVWRALKALAPLDLNPKESYEISATVLENIGSAISVLQSLTKAQTACSFMQDATFKWRKAGKELRILSEEAAQTFRQINCPIKGRVYYTDEKCIPRGD